MNERIETDAADIFHDDAGPERIVQRGIVKGDHIGMLEASHQQHFPLKTLAKLRIAGDVLVHDLDDNLPAEIALLGQIDATHAPLAEEFHGLVSTQECSAGHGWCPLDAR